MLVFPGGVLAGGGVWPVTSNCVVVLNGPTLQLAQKDQRVEALCLTVVLLSVHLIFFFFLIPVGLSGGHKEGQR